MKRIVFVIICILIFSMSVGPILAEEEQPLLSVDVHADGSFTVTTGVLPRRDWWTREYNSLVIYTQEELEDYIQSGDEIMPILWWVPAADEVTIIDYPEQARYLRYPNREAQAFVDGPRSLLRPGKYYVEVFGYYGMIAGPLEFEIPEITVTPTPQPTPQPTEPPVTLTPEATPQVTPSPTVKPITPTVGKPATPTAAVDSEGNDNHAVLWICIGAAALVVIGTVVIILVKRKK